MKKILVVLIAFLFFLTGCQEQKTISNEKKEIDGIIVDVRTKEEYAEGHVVGAINIPYDEIDENVDLDKSKTIYVYCKSGTRSNIAYQNLKELGYDVVDLGAYASITLDKE